MRAHSSMRLTRCIVRAVPSERGTYSDRSAAKHVVPVVRVVEDHAAADERGAKQRRKEQDELPYSRALIRKDLQLAVEVQAEGGEAGEGDGGVPGGPGL